MSATTDKQLPLPVAPDASRSIVITGLVPVIHAMLVRAQALFGLPGQARQ
jgi:hypothetical protein